MLGSSWHTPPGGRGSVSGDPGGGATISGHALYIVKTMKDRATALLSPPNKSPLSESPAYRGLLAVLHKLCKVEESLRNLRDVGDRESQLQISHQVLFLSHPQLHPAGNEGCIE